MLLSQQLTISEIAQRMIDRYGKDAEVHCTYTIMNATDTNHQYWRTVYDEIINLRKPRHE